MAKTGYTILTQEIGCKKPRNITRQFAKKGRAKRNNSRCSIESKREKASDSSKDIF